MPTKTIIRYIIIFGSLLEYTSDKGVFYQVDIIV